MNIIGNSVRLQDQAGRVADGGASSVVLVLAITQTLVGSLTLSGISNSDGSAATWTLPPGTTAGVYSAPGSGATGGAALWYSFSSANDSGAAVIAYHRVP